MNRRLGQAARKRAAGSSNKTSPKKPGAQAPDPFAEALRAGLALHRAGDRARAIEAYRGVLSQKPDHPVALQFLGVALAQIGDNVAAKSQLSKAIELAPEYADAHHGLGDLWMAEGDTGAAIACFRKALECDPNYVPSHNNLGSLLLRIGHIDAAIASLRRAAELNASHPEIQLNLAMAYRYHGDMSAALDAYAGALKLKPGFMDLYISLGHALAILAHRGGGGDSSGLDAWIERLRALEPDASYSCVLDYFPCVFDRENLPAVYERAVAQIRSAEADRVALPSGGDQTAKAPPLPERMVALMNYGRSGSGLIHSLFDGHPQITTLPGIYMKGFFRYDVWDTIRAAEPTNLAPQFSRLYEVLFDARNPKGVPGNPTGRKYGVGESEGFTHVGPRGNEFLSLDRAAFEQTLNALMQSRKSIDHGDFFRAVHAAFEAAQGKQAARELIFYHIHNPNFFELSNFRKYFPDAKLLMIVREPLQSCEAWLSQTFSGPGDYVTIVNNVVRLLFDVDRIEFSLNESAGVRLEDLKNDPKRTMRALCRWMGIEETESLYQPTMQGKTWWGDPSSSLFGNADPFNKEAISRPLGRVLSQRDQFVLGTLFYPFRRLYGYVEEDQTGFERDLAAIEPMIDEPFDFERALFAKAPDYVGDFTRYSLFEYLRAALWARWRFLNKGKASPFLLPPLKLG